MFMSSADAAEKQSESPVLNEAEQLLIDSIKGIKSGVSQTIDFAKEQVPDVIYQLVLYKTILYGFWLTVGILSLVLAFFVGKKVYKETLKSYKEAHEGVIVLGGVFVIILSIYGVTSIGCYMSNFIQITFAPKVWLLEYAASLLKGH